MSKIFELNSHVLPDSDAIENCSKIYLFGTKNQIFTGRNIYIHVYIQGDQRITPVFKIKYLHN